MNTDDPLRIVLRPPAVRQASDVRAFWNDTAAIRAGFTRPIDRAIASAAFADRVGYAFAVGYEAAVAALVPTLGPSQVASFCVTEAGGGHPRAIATRVEHAGSDVVLTGEKRWSTMAPLSDVLVVVAKEGMDEQGRPRLKAVWVPRNSPGLSIREMPSPPFVPEVPHAELTLESVRISAEFVLPGDGFVDYSKAFRTVEDVHVNAAVLAYLMAVAARRGWAEGVRERGAALLLAIREISARDPKSPETHVALAGLLDLVGRLVSEAEPDWSRVGDAERQRWQRDRGLVQVAGKAREQRRQRAWQLLWEEGKG